MLLKSTPIWRRLVYKSLRITETRSATRWIVGVPRVEFKDRVELWTVTWEVRMGITGRSWFPLVTVTVEVFVAVFVSCNCNYDSLYLSGTDNNFDFNIKSLIELMESNVMEIPNKGNKNDTYEVIILSYFQWEGTLLSWDT